MKVCVGFGLCRRAAYVVAVAVSCCRCAADVTSADSGTYSPPILANGDIGMLIDYRNCHFQDVPSYRTIHAVGVDFLPGIYRQARRTQDGKLAALGRFEERVLLAGGKASSPESWRHRLDTDRALSLAENVYEGGARIESTAFVAAHCPVVCVRKSFEGDIESYSFDYLFCAPGTAGGLPHGATAVFRPGEISYSFGRAGKSKGFTGTISVFCSHPDAASTVLDSGVRLTVAKPKGTVDFFVVYRDSLDDDPADADSIRKAGRDGLLAAHCASWRDFWSRSSLDIPDRKIFSTWRTALYNLKCWSTKWSIPVGILPTHWNGAYFGFTFFGPALCSSGHIPEAVKVAKFWDSVRPFALSRAGKPSRDKYAGLHYSWQTVENGTEGASGGRWLDHYLHLSNISRECWTAWLYTNDRGLLASNAYPVVKGCARRFRSAQVYELKDGRTIIGAVCDLERLPCPARNAFLTTCGAIYCFEKAAEGSDILGIDREEAAEWRRIAAALKRDLPKNAQRYLALEGYEGTSVALLSGLMPYNVLAKDDPFHVVRRVARRGAGGSGRWRGCVPQSEACHRQRRAFQRNIRNQRTGIQELPVVLVPAGNVCRIRQQHVCPVRRRYGACRSGGSAGMEGFLVPPPRPRRHGAFGAHRRRRSFPPHGAGRAYALRAKQAFRSAQCRWRAQER